MHIVHTFETCDGQERSSRLRKPLDSEHTLKIPYRCVSKMITDIGKGIDGPQTAERDTTEAKRINISLSDRAYSELQAASKETRRSMTEIVRLSLGLVKILLEAEKSGHRVYVTTSDGQAVKELVLPS
jgi:hypothetical protein